jgi:hypothetical protein
MENGQNNTDRLAVYLNGPRGKMARYATVRYSLVWTQSADEFGSHNKDRVLLFSSYKIDPYKSVITNHLSGQTVNVRNGLFLDRG